MKIIRDIEVPLKLTLTSVGISTINNSLANPSLSKAGEIFTSFISPAVNISASSMLINKLREVKNGIQSKR